FVPWWDRHSCLSMCGRVEGHSCPSRGRTRWAGVAKDGKTTDKNVCPTKDPKTQRPKDPKTQRPKDPKTHVLSETVPALSGRPFICRRQQLRDHPVQLPVQIRIDPPAAGVNPAPAGGQRGVFDQF